MTSNNISFKNICRLCAKTNNYLLSLYDFDQDGISFEEKLKTICGIEIGSADVLPKKICQLCHTKLENSYQFRNMCLSSIHILARYLDDNDGVEEYLESEFETDNTADDSEILYYLEVDEDYLAENTSAFNLSDIESYFNKPDKNNGETKECTSDKNMLEEYLEDSFIETNLNNSDNTKNENETIENHEIVNEINSNQVEEENETVIVKKKLNTHRHYNSKVNNHDTKKKNKCKVCHKRFNSENKVKLHMQRIHRQIYLQECKVTCRKCGMKFEHTRNLKRHMVYHNVTYSFFGCNFCDKKLYSKKSWRKHIKIHDEKINEICKICNKTLFTSVGKVYHMDYHRTKETLTNKTFYCCHTCTIDFTKYEELEAHVIAMHLKDIEHSENKTDKSITQHFDDVERNFEKIFNETPNSENDSETKNSLLENIKSITLKCNICNLYYKNLLELKNHVTECYSKINVPKSFMCDICGKCFKSAFLLTNHKAGHSSLRKFICDICGQRFKWYNDLINHVSRIHENIRPYVCKYCGKTCATSATLKAHYRSHNKERPYSCQICNAAFAQNCSLKEHMFKHTGGQDSTCSICNKVFKTPLRLRTHMKRHNTQRKLYPCDICNRMYTEKSSVKKHRQKFHNYSYPESN